jgi:hypothetical protein
MMSIMMRWVTRMISHGRRHVRRHVWSRSRRIMWRKWRRISIVAAYTLF